jgi:membrane-associated protease RseP (regulator of RpoE activity)
MKAPFDTGFRRSSGCWNAGLSGCAERRHLPAPVARAAWIGLLATAWNLLPIGQLDGGHVLYSLAGRWHKMLTWIFLGVLVVLGIRFWHGWLVWAVLLYFLAGATQPL